MASLIKVVAKGLTTTVLFFLLVEGAIRGVYFVRNALVPYVPLPYAFGDNYGPMPPWLDRFEILQNDRALIWRNVSDAKRTYLDIYSPVRTEDERRQLLRRFWPTLPPEFRANHIWHVELNADGFRGRPFSQPRPSRVVRIACVGDSWTFGMPVDQDEAFPVRLAAWLRQEQPDLAYEVANFGVLGYTSFQGRELMTTRIAALHPDVVVIGFGMNDSDVAGYRDKDMVAPPPTIGERAKHLFTDLPSNSEDYKLLKYTALLARFRPTPLSQYLKPGNDVKNGGPVDYESLEPWTRVSPHDYEENLRDMIRQTRALGARTILLDNELWAESPYRVLLKRLSRELDVPLVDSLAMIMAGKQQIERKVAQDFDLTPSVPPAADLAEQGKSASVVFRLYRGGYAVSTHLSIVGFEPQLGGGVPNTVALHDDGQDGDERAGDSVWSLRVTLPAGKTISYLYTNSGTPGRWDGLDLPHVRSLTVPAADDGQPVYLPVETFGQVYLQGDDWHTDKIGYDMIGHAVAQIVERFAK